MGSLGELPCFSCVSIALMRDTPVGPEQVLRLSVHDSALSLVRNVSYTTACMAESLLSRVPCLHRANRASMTAVSLACPPCCAMWAWYRAGH
jgi:hypothetical protein